MFAPFDTLLEDLIAPFDGVYKTGVFIIDNINVMQASGSRITQHGESRCLKRLRFSP